VVGVHQPCPSSLGRRRRVQLGGTAGDRATVPPNVPPRFQPFCTPTQRGEEPGQGISVTLQDLGGQLGVR